MYDNRSLLCGGSWITDFDDLLVQHFEDRLPRLDLDHNEVVEGDEVAVGTAGGEVQDDDK